MSPDLVESPAPNSIAPSMMFMDRIPGRYFPDCGDMSGVKQTFSLTETNVAVLSLSAVVSLERALADLDLLFSSDLTEYEKTMCHWLSQVMSVVLETVDQKLSLIGFNFEKDITIATMPQECSSVSEYRYPLLVIPSVVYESGIIGETTENAAPDMAENWNLVCMEVAKLLFLLLKLKGDPKGNPSEIPLRTKYSKGLQKFVRILQEGTLQAFIQAKVLLESILWGPQEEEIKSLTLAENRLQAFQIWLDLRRCQIVGDVALGKVPRDLAAANQMWFLCAATGKSLFDMAKLLYM